MQCRLCLISLKKVSPCDKVMKSQNSKKYIVRFHDISKKSFCREFRVKVEVHAL